MFIIDLTSGFNILRKDSCKSRRGAFNTKYKISPSVHKLFCSCQICLNLKWFGSYNGYYERTDVFEFWGRSYVATVLGSHGWSCGLVQSFINSYLPVLLCCKFGGTKLQNTFDASNDILSYRQKLLFQYMGPLSLTWINLNPNMYK